MEATPNLPSKRTNYMGSFYIEKDKSNNDVAYRVKNKEDWMDAFINNGHIVWNSTSGARVKGTHHYNKGQKAANDYITKAKVKLKID